MTGKENLQFNTALELCQISLNAQLLMYNCMMLLLYGISCKRSSEPSLSLINNLVLFCGGCFFGVFLTLTLLSRKRIVLERKGSAPEPWTCAR